MEEQSSFNQPQPQPPVAPPPAPSNKGKKIAYDIILAVLIVIFGISAFMLIRYYGQTASSKSMVSELADSYVQYATETPGEQPAEQQTPTETGYYHAPIPSGVDLASLKAQNSDVVGWLFNQNGVINYPVLQGTDNDYYLDHLLSGKKNVNGSLFLSYTNQSDFSGPVSIIYGHSMKNGTMFATLLRYRNQNYYAAYPSFYLYTPGGNFRADVVAAYECVKDDRAFATMQDVAAKQQFLTYAMSRSVIRTGLKVEDSDRLLLLSTCAYSSDDARFVVVCKMVPLEGNTIAPLALPQEEPSEQIGNTSEQVAALESGETDPSDETQSAETPDESDVP